MDFTKGTGQRGIGKTSEQPLLLSGRECRPKAECLDEQHLDKALENQITAGTVCVRFLTSQFYDSTQARRPFLFAPDVDDRRQKSHEKPCIRTIKAEIPPEHSHRHGA